MNTEEFFSVYGSGYAQQRQVGFELFWRAIPQRVRTVGVGLAISAVLGGALGVVAHNVMTTVKAGAEATVAQNHR